VRDNGKAKTGAAEKPPGVTAARADTKGRSTPDHHGEMFKVFLNQSSFNKLSQGIHV